jgi:hypothetical protein
VGSRAVGSTFVIAMAKHFEVGQKCKLWFTNIHKVIGEISRNAKLIMDLGDYSAADRFRSTDFEHFVSTEETRTLNQVKTGVLLQAELCTKCSLDF